MIRYNAHEELTENIGYVLDSLIEGIQLQDRLGLSIQILEIINDEEIKAKDKLKEIELKIFSKTKDRNHYYRDFDELPDWYNTAEYLQDLKEKNERETFKREYEKDLVIGEITAFFNGYRYRTKEVFSNKEDGRR